MPCLAAGDSPQPRSVPCQGLMQPRQGVPALRTEHRNKVTGFCLKKPTEQAVLLLALCGQLDPAGHSGPWRQNQLSFHSCSAWPRRMAHPPCRACPNPELCLPSPWAAGRGWAPAEGSAMGTQGGGTGDTLGVALPAQSRRALGSVSAPCRNQRCVPWVCAGSSQPPPPSPKSLREGFVLSRGHLQRSCVTLACDCEDRGLLGAFL